jgi:hypothetical protein
VADQYGNLSANLEFEQTTLLDDKKTNSNGNDLAAHALRNDVQVLFNIGTAWL